MSLTEEHHNIHNYKEIAAESYLRSRVLNLEHFQNGGSVICYGHVAYVIHKHLQTKTIQGNIKRWIQRKLSSINDIPYSKYQNEWAIYAVILLFS